MKSLDPDNTNNQVILILKYYLYKCRCLGDKPSINGGIKYLKYCITIEKTTINFFSPTQIRVITKLPNSEQSYKGKVKTHNYIDRQNQSTTGKL